MKPILVTAQFDGHDQVIRVNQHLGKMMMEALKAITIIYPNCNMWLDWEGDKMKLRKLSHFVPGGSYVSSDREMAALYYGVQFNIEGHHLSEFIIL